MARRLAAVLVVVAAFVAACGGAASAPAPTPVSVPRLSAPLPAEIQQKGKLNVGVKCDYPPFGYTDENGSTVGYEIDMVRRMAEDNVAMVRSMALLLRPSMLDELGLVPALKWQAREVTRRAGHYRSSR